jgi:5'(3')-deoxyribonucleotidase
MTIILDLDDVLANLRESLYRTLTRASGIDLHWRHWRSYDLCEHYPTVCDRLDEILVDDRTLESCRPEPGAQAATRGLSKLGFEIAIVTARGWHPRAEAVTRHWLDKHGIRYDHLSIVSLGSNKLGALTPFRRIALAVDDHPDHVRRYQQAGIPAALMDRPWNAGCEGERIFSLEGMVELAGRFSEPRKSQGHGLNR